MQPFKQISKLCSLACSRCQCTKELMFLTKYWHSKCRFLDSPAITRESIWWTLHLCPSMSVICVFGENQRRNCPAMWQNNRMFSFCTGVRFTIHKERKEKARNNQQNWRRDWNSPSQSPLYQALCWVMWGGEWRQFVTVECSCGVEFRWFSTWSPVNLIVKGKREKRQLRRQRLSSVLDVI